VSGFISLTQRAKIKLVIAKIKLVIGCVAVLFAFASVATVEAKGCRKGTVMGGTAELFAGHLGLVGAAAGCVIGRHKANERTRETTAKIKMATRWSGARHALFESNI